MPDLLQKFIDSPLYPFLSPIGVAFLKIRLFVAHVFLRLTEQLFKNPVLRWVHQELCISFCLYKQQTYLRQCSANQTKRTLHKILLSTNSQHASYKSTVTDTWCNVNYANKAEPKSCPDHQHWYLLCDENVELLNGISQLCTSKLAETRNSYGFYFDEIVRQDRYTRQLRLKPNYDSFLQKQTQYIGGVICLNAKAMGILACQSTFPHTVSDCIALLQNLITEFALTHIPLCVFKSNDSELKAPRRLPVKAPNTNAPAESLLVSIIIPTRNGKQLVETCIESIARRTANIPYEIILIDNQSDCVDSKNYFEKLKAQKRVHLLHYDRPFNYSAINNFAARAARGDILLFMNNDIEVINSHWLLEMVRWGRQKDIGAVGAKLYYPNETIQHAGVILGLWGCAGHGHKHYPKGACGYMGRLDYVQQFSAVTGALLAVSKEKFIEVGGFNEKDLSVSFNDVDLCLKLQQKGYKNIWTPHAEAYHHESVSRGAEDTPEKKAREQKEIQYMQSTWKLDKITDTAYNPWLTHNKEDFSIRDLRELKRFTWNR